MLLLTSILILGEKQIRCRTTSLWKQSTVFLDHVLAHKVYVSISFSELQIHLACQTIHYSLNKKMLTKEGWPSKMRIVFDPWSRRKPRTASTPHQVTSMVSWVSFAEFLQAAWLISKNQKGLFLPSPTAGTAWHWEARLDSFHAAYQKSPQEDHAGQLRAYYTHCPCTPPPPQHPWDAGCAATGVAEGQPVTRRQDGLCKAQEEVTLLSPW